MDSMSIFEDTPDDGLNRKFYFLNKDRLIAKFHVVGKGNLEKVSIDEQFIEMPEWIPNLGEFIRNRRAPKQRENIEKLLEMSGCNTISGWLNITYALSLIDTYWVKPMDSDLSWEKVSLAVVGLLVQFLMLATAWTLNIAANKMVDYQAKVAQLQQEKVQLEQENTQIESDYLNLKFGIEE